ncbi:unnamed protein product [Adineta steineri]|uniref:G-protein coupled receptors family 1 profile domain-containing protein n=2 Tax=Adineta steineri TaxID=433720 RepID=A0A815LRL2_9BILA|nr:unnamed protein product [Adineta steineri]
MIFIDNIDTLVNGSVSIHHVKFIITLSLQIPALILSFLIFLFFITNQVHLRKLQNQALLVLFIINFIQLSSNISLLVHFLHLSRISPATGTYCKFWLFLESTLDASNAFLAAVISIQRHTLVFQPNILRIRLKRYIFYYSPLCFAFCYPAIFYLGAVVFYHCDDSQWNFELNMCGDTICYLSNNQILATYDWIVNTALPIIIIIFANATLVIRVIEQKHRRQQTISWSKQRRMTLQLLSISSLYLVTWIPSIVSGLMQQVNPTEHLYDIQENYISDLTYLICLLLPWMYIGLVPDFKKWMLKHFRRLKRPPNTIGTLG